MVACVLYISPVLPTLSETFVYNEVFRLRERGLTVHVASVRPPQRGLGDPRLDELAEQAVPIYGTGPWSILADFSRELLAHPLIGLGTVARGLADAVAGADVTWSRRPKVAWQALAGVALARRVRARGIEHIHAHFAHVPSMIAMYAARQLGVGFSFTGHANDLFMQRTLLPAKLRRATFVACISHWHRDYYRALLPGLDNKRLPVVRCGVSVPDMERSNEKDRPLHIVSVGRLVPKKGFDVLIAAISRLRRDGLDIRCSIIGDGSQREELAALISDAGLTGSVLLIGAQPHDRVRRSVAQGDLFVLPCRPDDRGDHDGIPVALMEAMAAGVAVISGDLPTIRELIEHGRTGLLAPPGDAEALAAAIRTLAADRQRRHEIAQAGRQWVVQEFSDRVNTDRLLAALNATTTDAADRQLQKKDHKRSSQSLARESG